MNLEKESFKRYHEEKKLDSFTVRLNREERELLNKAKMIIEQEKDSTTLKQLAWIGANVIQDNSTAAILGYVFKNKRNNKRLGIVTFD